MQRWKTCPCLNFPPLPLWTIVLRRLDGIIVITLRLARLILCNCVPMRVSNSACAEALSQGDFDECLWRVSLVSLSLKMQIYYHQETASPDCRHIDFLSALTCF